MEQNGVRHRADIRLPSGLVIELQHSSIATNDIKERESFYGNMIWVFDVKDPYDCDRLLFIDKGAFISFRWLQPRKHLAYVRKPAYLDVGIDVLFNMRKMSFFKNESTGSYRCGGWGKWVQLRSVTNGINVNRQTQTD